jgi:ABC-2 type transport system ATP-binding protein
MEPVLKMINVTKKYKNDIILNNINLTINKNEIVGLLGDNGSGKTTLMKCILNLTKINSGNIFINEQNINNKLAYKKVGSLIENPKLFENMTGYENLYYFSLLYNESCIDINSISKILDIETFLHKKVSTYSLGMKQKILLAQALINDPNFLLLDEPMNGLDISTSFKLKEYINSLSTKSSIIISSHILSDIEYLCDRILVLNNGVLTELNKNNSDDIEKEILITTNNAIASINIIKSTLNKEAKLIEPNTLSINISNILTPSIIKILVDNSIEIFEVYEKKISLEENYKIFKKGDYN